MNRQPDLFKTLPPGLRYREHVIDFARQRELIEQLKVLPLAPFRFQGWQGRRLTASFGWRYDFNGGGFSRTDPIPAFLLPYQELAATFAGIASRDIEQVLVTRYDPGAQIGWHKDRPEFAEILGLSLGTTADLRFRRRVDKGFDRVNLTLAPGSLYHLAGIMRRDWEHSIGALVATRWSVTFRTLHR